MLFNLKYTTTTFIYCIGLYIIILTSIQHIGSGDTYLTFDATNPWNFNAELTHQKQTDFVIHFNSNLTINCKLVNSNYNNPHVYQDILNVNSSNIQFNKSFNRAGLLQISLNYMPNTTYINEIQTKLIEEGIPPLISVQLEYQYNLDTQSNFISQFIGTFLSIIGVGIILDLVKNFYFKTKLPDDISTNYPLENKKSFSRRSRFQGLLQYFVAKISDIRFIVILALFQLSTVGISKLPKNTQNFNLITELQDGFSKTNFFIINLIIVSIISFSSINFEFDNIAFDLIYPIERKLYWSFNSMSQLLSIFFFNMVWTCTLIFYKFNTLLNVHFMFYQIFLLLLFQMCYTFIILQLFYISYIYFNDYFISLISVVILYELGIQFIIKNYPYFYNTIYINLLIRSPHSVSVWIETIISIIILCFISIFSFKRLEVKK